MLETALANVRFGSSMVFGRPFHRRSLDRIIEAVRATHEEFGQIGVGADELLGGPSLDEDTRKIMQGRRFRAQALRAANETSYYRDLFTGELDPRKFRFEDIQSVPVTRKEALRDDPEAFVRSGSRPTFRSTTTGTTGGPTTVWFSDEENHLIGVLSAITFLGQRIIEPEDFVQIAISTRARLGVHGVTFSANAIGAVVHPAGVVKPEHTLALLSEQHKLPGKKSRVSVMSTYPSYLGELLVEVLDMDAQERPVSAGEAGVIVATPLPPFRGHHPAPALQHRRCGAADHRTAGLQHAPGASHDEPPRQGPPLGAARRRLDLRP